MRNCYSLCCFLLLNLLIVPRSYAQRQTKAPRQQASLQSARQGRYVLKLSADNKRLICQPATLKNIKRLQQNASVSGQRAGTHLVRSTNAPNTLKGLRIILRATDQLMERPEALIAFRRAAAAWERRINSDITVVIDVDYGPNRFGGPAYAQGVLGSTFSGARALSADPTAIRERLLSAHSDNAQLQQLYNAIPDSVPSTALDATGHPVMLKQALAALPNAQVLGFAPADINANPSATPFGSVPNIGFNSNYPFDLDPNDGVDPNLFDFQSVATHEMGHALGFDTIIGNGGPPDNLFYPWDLFRVRPDSVEPGAYDKFADARRVVTPGPPAGTSPLTPPVDTVNGQVFYAPAQVFFDGKAEYETSTATGAGEGGDNNQASHWRDDALRLPSLDDTYIGIMDPNFGRGRERGIEYPDIRLLEVIGYNVTPDPDFAGIALRFNGSGFDLSTTPDTLDFGDTEVGETNEIRLQVQNPDSLSESTLYFDTKPLIDYSTPKGAALNLDASTTSDTVGLGDSETITLQYSADQPSVFFGRLRLRTNADSIFVAEVPFRLSIGGAVRPTLTVDTENLGAIGNLDPGESLTQQITVRNEGTLPLDYRVRTALSTRSIPFDTRPTGAIGKKASPYARFYGARAAAEADTLIDAHFQHDLGAFRETGGWQHLKGHGADTLGGHSIPSSAYFGVFIERDSLTYRNNSTGLLLSPAFNLSNVPGEDLVSLAFNYYLQAEEGYDFASVVVSYDGGDTFETVATSDNGVLSNTDEGWRSAVINLESASGYPKSLKVGFLFESDAGVRDEGWYVDDVQVFTSPNENPLYTNPRAGTLPNSSASSTVDVTINANPLETGFYEANVQVVANDFLNPTATDSLQFRVGDPGLPSLATRSLETTVYKGTRTNKSIPTKNVGDAPVTYVRVMEPALSRYETNPEMSASDQFAKAAALRDARSSSDKSEAVTSNPKLDHSAAPRNTVKTATAAADGDSLFSATLPTGFAIGLAQLPDGRLVAVETSGGKGLGPRAFVLSEDLSNIKTFKTRLPATSQVTGAAYNKHTGTLWLSVFQASGLLEFAFTKNGLVFTGNSIPLGFSGVATDYSPKLNAFLVIEYQSNRIYAVDPDGNFLPGYPVEFPRGSFYQGLSVTNGVFEVGYQDAYNFDAVNYVQLDQFARLFTESRIVEARPSLISGAQRVNGLVRSHTQPDSVMYYLTNAGSDNLAHVVGVDPPDLPDYTQRSLLDAKRPLYEKELRPGARDTLSVSFDTRGREIGTYQDKIALLVNNPTDQVVQFPVEVKVRFVVANEEGPDVLEAFALHQNYPNPFRQKTNVTFDLPDPAQTTMTVYNVLGQRVAVLMRDKDLTAGTYEVSFNADRLSSGVYFVHVKAGRYSAVQRMVVVR